MVGDNEAVQPVKGDVRRYIEGGYKPVGATSGQVLTQGPDWDGINRGIGMFLDIGSNYARRSGGGSSKQDYSGQYQVEMNDIASNPAFHNANGTYNSKGNEAIRALNQKYAPYVSGAEIRATESSVGGGYKESVDSALRESFIKQQTADYEAQNKRFVEMYDAAHPENINAPYETRARLGRRLSDQAGEFMDLTNTLRNNKIESITDPAKRRMAQILMDRMNSDQLDRFINSGDTVKDQQELTDSIASLAVQLGSTPQEAMVMATDATRGVFAHLNKYKNDLQQLSEDELKFMKSHDADEAYIDLSPEDKAFYALTGQFSQNVMVQGLTGNISVGDAFKTTKVGDTYKRKLITSDKNVLNFALNNGDSLTASAALNNIVPQMQEELNKGNSAPLRMLNRLPSMANIVNEPNTDPETIKFLEDAIATDIVRNSRHYYKGDNRITDEMDYQNRAAVELAQFLGFSNEKTKDIVNKALTTMGLKQINGVYTPDELVGAMSAQTVMPWAMEGVDVQPQGKDVNDYLSDENKMTVAPTEEQPQVVNDEANQMSKINVYETPEYQEFRSKIVKAVKNKQMTREQGINEDNQFLTRAKAALAKIAEELTVKSAKADTIPYKEGERPYEVVGRGGQLTPAQVTNIQSEEPRLPAGSDKGYLERTASTNTFINEQPKVKSDYDRGTIDLNNRPIVMLDNGKFATEMSFSIKVGDKEVLIPQVVDGRLVSKEEAIKHFEDTNEYLGVFDTVAEANKYAKELSKKQEKKYKKRAKEIWDSLSMSDRLKLNMQYYRDEDPKLPN